ncbi:MAG TPA: DUF1552 domain-containing protein [Sandaracinaceae bacterium]
MKLSRRIVLRGTAGAVVALPFLESVLDGGPSVARADGDAPPFAIFFRQANGVACAQNTSELGMEPERFWPRTEGALTTDSLRDRALDELVDYRSNLLVVGNVNMQNFDYGDGHARGALQCLTARGPTVAGAGGASEAAGESIDHRIGRELHEDGRDSWFMYAGRNDGWLGGACISYRGPGNRRSPIHNPYEAYRMLVGGDAGLSAEAQRQIVERGRSVNDLVRAQLSRLIARPELSRADKERLELHQAAIRDLEVRLTCQLDEDRERALEGVGSSYASTDGDEVLAAARLHMDVAALAIACGVTRSVAIQVGNGNDGNTRYRDPSGAPMENFHYLSHRRLSHDASGTVLSNSDLMHHYVDRAFARTFRHLLDRLSEYEMPSGRKLLDCGVAVWFNDLGNGPGHSRMNVPFILAGSAGGFFKQGEYVRLGGGNEANHARLLNTIGTAVGLRTGDGPLSDFGDPSLPKALLTELMAPGVTV